MSGSVRYLKVRKVERRMLLFRVQVLCGESSLLVSENCLGRSFIIFPTPPSPLILPPISSVELSKHKVCMQFPKVIGSSCLWAITFKISSVVNWWIRLQLLTLWCQWSVLIASYCPSGGSSVRLPRGCCWSSMCRRVSIVQLMGA